jgi:hypothetical protein
MVNEDSSVNKVLNVNVSERFSMKQYVTMQWVQYLPTVDDSILRLLDTVDENVRKAAELEAQAAKVRSIAYFQCLHLESVIRNHWTDEHIANAKKLHEMKKH